MNKIDWEIIEKSYHGSYSYTYRAKVIGGWLIRVATSHGIGGHTEALTFVPDPNHNWSLE